MSSWQIKQGNSSIQDVAIKDSEGNLVSDLDQTSAIKFQVKSDINGQALIEKTKNDGIQINTPSSGYVRITLDPADTELNPGIYHMALELTYSDGRKYEVNLKASGMNTSIFYVTKDII